MTSYKVNAGPYSGENIYRKVVSFWPNELPLGQRVLAESGGMLSRKKFKIFFPKIAGNASKFYKLLYIFQL